MARSQGSYLRKPQGNRRLAPAQVAAFAITSFLCGAAASGGGVSSALAGVASFCAAAVFFMWSKSAWTAILILTAFVLGMFHYQSFFSARAALISIPFETRVDFSGTVITEPGRSTASEYFSMRLAPPYRGTIRVVAAPDGELRYGDLLALRGRVREPEAGRDLPVSIFPEIEILERNQGPVVGQALANLKTRLLEVFPRHLPSEQAAFLGGITLGARASFTPEFRGALAASGTTHLVALSGYNIAILVFVVFGASILFLGRRASFYLTIVAIVVFVAMVGAEPSVVRAAAMAFVFLLARELGRPYGLPYAILWTAFFMTLYDPGSLFTPGFQLSFMSLLGIVYVSPLILKLLGQATPEEDTGFLSTVRQAAALTVAAQLAVAPIVIFHFGSVPLSSFIANAMILPFIPITMFFGFVLLACSLVFPALGFVPAFAAHVLLSYEVAIIKFFARISLPISPEMGGFGIVIYYLALAVIVRRYGPSEEAIRR